MAARDEYKQLGVSVLSETIKVKNIRSGEIFDARRAEEKEDCFEILSGGLIGSIIHEENFWIIQENNVQNSNEPQYDNVNKPFHYHDKGLDPLTIMKATFTREQLIGFVKGSALKYLMRYEKKNGVEDIEKLAFYSKLLKELEDETT